MITNAAYPHLSNFLGCTFHQDWDDVAETYQGVVDVDIPSWNKTEMWNVERDVGDILALPVTDEELTSWIHLVGGCVVLPEDGHTSRSFLAMIGERIRAHHPRP